jgi:hypothetical protein
VAAPTRSPRADETAGRVAIEPGRSATESRIPGWQAGSLDGMTGAAFAHGPPIT